MPFYRAVYHIDCTGYSKKFEARDAAHAKERIESEEAGDWDRGDSEVGDVIELLDIVEVKSGAK